MEGLIASSATFANIADKQGLLNIIEIYEEVYENLKLHDRDYPTPDYLKKITKVGFSGVLDTFPEQ